MHFCSAVEERSTLAEVKTTVCGNVSACGAKTFDILLVSNMVKDVPTEELLRYMVQAAPVVIFCMDFCKTECEEVEHFLLLQLTQNVACQH